MARKVMDNTTRTLKRVENDPKDRAATLKVAAAMGAAKKSAAPVQKSAPQKKTATAATSHVTTAVAESMKPKFEEWLTSEEKHSDDGERLDQIGIRLCLEYHENAYNARSNTNPVEEFTRMVNASNRELTDFGNKWLSSVVLDFVPNTITKPKDSEPDKRKWADWNKQRARKAAVRRVAKIAIAIGAMGGKSTDWNEDQKCMDVPHKVYEPVLPPKSSGLQVWQWLDDEDKLGKLPMNGGGFTLRRKPNGQPTEENVWHQGRMNIKYITDTFFATPAHLKTDDKPQGTTSQNRGTQSATPTQLTAPQRKIAFDTATIYEAAEALANRIDANATADLFRNVDGKKDGDKLQANVLKIVMWWNNIKLTGDAAKKAA